MNQDEILGRIVRQYETDLRSADDLTKRIRVSCDELVAEINACFDAASAGCKKIGVAFPSGSKLRARERADAVRRTLDAIVTYCEVRERWLREPAQRWRDLCDLCNVHEGADAEAMLAATRTRTPSPAGEREAARPKRSGVYIAAPWNRKDDMREIAMRVRELVHGCTVNSTWHDLDIERKPDDADHADRARAQVRDEINKSALLLAIDSGPSKGLHYEIGIADALGVKVIRVARDAGVSISDSLRKHWVSVDVFNADIATGTGGTYEALCAAALRLPA